MSHENVRFHTLKHAYTCRTKLPFVQGRVPFLMKVLGGFQPEQLLQKVQSVLSSPEASGSMVGAVPSVSVQGAEPLCLGLGST